MYHLSFIILLSVSFLFFLKTLFLGWETAWALYSFAACPMTPTILLFRPLLSQLCYRSALSSILHLSWRYSFVSWIVFIQFCSIFLINPYLPHCECYVTFVAATVIRFWASAPSYMMLSLILKECIQFSCKQKLAKILLSILCKLCSSCHAVAQKTLWIVICASKHQPVYSSHGLCQVYENANVVHKNKRSLKPPQKSAVVITYLST